MSFNMSIRTLCPSGRFVHQDETSACYQNDQDDLSQDEMSQDETSQDDLSVRTKRLLAPQWRSLFWGFLLDMVPFLTMQNFIFDWGPLLPFLEFFEILDKFCLLKFFWFFFCAKSGSLPCQKIKFWEYGIWNGWETSSYFWTFFYISKLLKGHLNL